jgi:hypothetical protein
MPRPPSKSGETSTSDLSILVAPCGMNCALCASYLAGQNHLKSKSIRIPECTGCRIRGKQCAYLKKHKPSCTKLLNSESGFCFQCPDYPCSHLKGIDARYQNRYHMSMIENLNFLKANGMSAFLEAQAKRWRCPTCGGTICCHNGLCFSCDLEKLRAKKQVYRWEDT